MFELLLGSVDLKIKQGWKQLTGPATGRNQSTSVVVGDKLYVFGGRLATTNAFNTASVYDFATDTWEEVSTGANVNLRADGGLVDNKFYVFGGYTGSADTNTMVEFTIDGTTITATTRSNAGIVARNSHAMAALGSNVYIFGGNGASGILSQFHRYDTTSFTATTLTSPYQIRYQSLTAYDGSLYTLGGLTTTTSSVSTFRRYTESGNNWTALTNGLISRNRHNAVAYNGRIWVFGGQQGTDSTPNPISNQHQFTYYDIASNTWNNIVLPSERMPPPRFYANMQVYNGKLYVTGGYTNGVYYNDLWVYDPANP